MQNPDKIIVTTILIVLLLCAYAVSGAQAADSLCVDCDLNKKEFEKTAEVMEIEWHNPDGTIQRSTKVIDGSQKILYNNVKPVNNDANQFCYVKVIINKNQMEIFQKKRNYIVPMEEVVYQIHLLIGNFLPSFTTVMLQHQSIADITVEKNTLLNRTEKCA